MFSLCSKGFSPGSLRFLPSQTRTRALHSNWTVNRTHMKTSKSWCSFIFKYHYVDIPFSNRNHSIFRLIADNVVNKTQFAWWSVQDKTTIELTTKKYKTISTKKTKKVNIVPIFVMQLLSYLVSTYGLQCHLLSAHIWIMSS